MGNISMGVRCATLLSAEATLAPLLRLMADPKLAPRLPPDIWLALRFSPATPPCISCHSIHSFIHSVTHAFTTHMKSPRVKQVQSPVDLLYEVLFTQAALYCHKVLLAVQYKVPLG